jgi:hypothetical protein
MVAAKFPMHFCTRLSQYGAICPTSYMGISQK